MIGDTTLIKNSSGARLEPYLDEFLRSHLPPRDVQASRTPEGDLQSLCVPRTMLRQQIIKDPDFRRTFRTLEVQVQDFDKKGRPGDLLKAKEYVADTQAIGVGKASAVPKPLKDSIRSMQEWLDSLGTVMKFGVIGLMIGIPLYAAFKTARFAAKVVDEYAEATAAAIETDAGLERAIRARSGQPPPAEKANVPEAEEHSSSPKPPPPDTLKRSP
jgi:hypothetical protein